MTGSAPSDRPGPYWNGPEDWYEFFRFACPSCKTPYVFDHGSAFAFRARPRPSAVRSRWDPTRSPVGFEAVVVCTCMARFEVRGANPAPSGEAPAGGPEPRA